MRTYLLKPIILACLGLSLSACGGKSSTSPKVFQNRNFVTQQADEKTQYNIQLRGQDFNKVSTQNADFLGLAPTALSASIKSAKLENDELEIRLNDKRITFPIDLQEGLKFQALNENGDYSVKGSCVDENCTQMAITFEHVDSAEVVEVLYSRSYEYLTQQNSANLQGISNELMQDAIRYKYPVARHSIRVNNSRDLDLLVVERPLADQVSEDFSINVKSQKQEHTKPKRARGEQRRLELDSSEIISVTVNVGQQNDGLTLTKNPFEAFQLDLPMGFFRNGYEVKEINNIKAIDSIEQQEPMEPAYRIAVLAQAFVKSGKPIFDHACNIFVRTVLRMAAYDDYDRQLLARDFHILFQKNKQGLRDWEKRHYDVSESGSLSRLRRDLLSAEENMGMVLQVDKRRLGKDHDHIGIVVIENGQIVIYDSSLDEHGPRRTVVTAENLLNANRPVLNLYSYPLLISSVQ